MESLSQLVDSAPENHAFKGIFYLPGEHYTFFF